jgi:hypothetical protein
MLAVSAEAAWGSASFMAMYQTLAASLPGSHNVDSAPASRAHPMFQIGSHLMHSLGGAPRRRMCRFTVVWSTGRRETSATASEPARGRPIARRGWGFCGQAQAGSGISEDRSPASVNSRRGRRRSGARRRCSLSRFLSVRRCERRRNVVLGWDAHVCIIWAHYHKLCLDSSHNIAHFA